MIVGVIQSNFIPWRGYFDLMDDVDLFIIHDDLQYTKGDWRNRNRIQTPTGSRWITVPVKYTDHRQLICDTPIDYASKQIRKLRNLVKETYYSAPFFNPIFEEFAAGFEMGFETISQLNIYLILWAAHKLGIDTQIRLSSEFNPVGTRTDRLIDLLGKAGADTYLSGPMAKKYIEMEKFRKNGISLFYKVYDYGSYPQLHPGGAPNLSILDLFFNCGPDAATHLKSRMAPEQIY